jgi:hypothetical protein
MAQAGLLEQKAREFRIDVDTDYPWEVCVCKRMFQGHLSLLKLSHDKVFSKIKEIKEELLAIQNYFEDLSDNTDDAQALMQKGHIHSAANILQEVRTAYTEILIASVRNEDKEKAESDQKEEGRAAGDGVIASCIKDISRSLFNCRDAIRRALKGFNDKL